MSRPDTRTCLDIGPSRHLAIVAVCVWAAYANALPVSFQFDDFNVIVDNAAVHSVQAWWQNVSHGGIRPVLKLSYALNWVMSQSPLGFHLLNVLAHTASAALVYLIALEFFARAGYAAPGRAALLSAMVFAMHPLQTEAVTYVSGRSSSLMAMFYMAGVLAYIKGRREGSRAWSIGVSGGFFALAVLTKETAVTMPAAIALWELSGGASAGESLRRGWAHWLMFSIMLTLLLLHPGQGAMLGRSADVRGAASHLLTMGEGIAYLITRLAAVGRLSIDPDINPVTSASPGAVLRLAVAAVMMAAAIAGIRRAPIAAFGVLWFFVHIAPTTLIPRFDVASERHMYLPMLGISMMAGAALSVAVSRATFIRVAGVAALLAVFGAYTIARNADYRTEISLWEDTVRTSPGNSRAFNNLGYAYYIHKRYDDAEAAYERALALTPDYGQARINLDALRRERGR